MPNRFQIKRTTTSGLLPNVSNVANTSYIAAGELAINLTDRKLLSSNGSATFEIGANLASMVVGTGFTQTSGNANFDSGVLFVDGTNNRVGIGNTTPAHALSVTGTTNLGGVVTITSNATLSGTNTHITSTNTSITSNVTISGTLNTTNPVFNNIKNGYSTTATAAGTTTLTSTSNYQQFFTGTTTQIVSLPAPQTMTLGQGFLIVNNSTGNLEVRASNSATVATVLAGTAVLFVSIDLTAGNGAAGWSAEIVGFSGITGTGNVVLATSSTLSNTTITGFANVTGTLAAGNTTVTGFANVSGIVSADYYTASNNGNGTNYRIGDDAWLGDINVADTVGLKGQQNSSLGFIKFGTAPSTFGYNGTALTYTSNVSLSNTKINDILTIANDKRIIFNNPTAGNGVRLVHQSDDNFVFYVASTTGAERAIFSVFSNSNTSSFAVQTAITATGDITAFFSDDRLKDRYSNISNAIEKVKSLNGFYYEPNITAQDLGYQKEMHVGVSAQEVNAIMPEVVAPAPIDNKYMTVKYERLIPLLIEAIKEQQIQIDELKAQLSKD
jgi:hypothetical protein